MNWLEGLLYGIVSGLSAFLPISSDAHQLLLGKLFGAEAPDPVRELLIHAAILASIYLGCKAYLDQLRRERKTHYARGTRAKPRLLSDFRLVRTATIPMLIVMLLISFSLRADVNLLISSAFLLVNAVVLFIPERLMQGNKDARLMSSLDGVLIGASAGLSAIPGISCTGMITSVSVMRGAARQNALNWAFLLSVPALSVLIGLDVLSLFSGGATAAFWSNFAGYVLGAAGAYIGGYFSIVLMKFLTVRAGYSGFAYYSLGAALFSFLLYLIVV